MKTITTAWLLCSLAVLSVLGSAARSFGDEPKIADSARKALQSYDKAVIVLVAVVKMEAKGLEGMGDREQKTQCVGQIVDASGLAITALSNLSPQATKLRVNRGGTPTTIEIEYQVQEVKYRLTDGTEVPARLVLKDPDLDVAFVAPTKPLDEPTRAKIAVIPFPESPAPVQLLDETFIIGRLPEDFNYLPLIRLGRIESILTTPRTCYMNTGAGIGATVFDSKGQLMGLLCRCVAGENSENRASRNVSLVLPVADIIRLVPQAKDEMKRLADEDKKAEAAEKAKPTEKKDDAEKKATSEFKPEADKKTDTEKKPTDAKPATEPKPEATKKPATEAAPANKPDSTEKPSEPKGSPAKKGLQQN